MGAFASVDLRPEDVRELQDLTTFEPKEIKTLYRRFRRLDRAGRGTISTDDLLMIPEISMNPLAPRLTTIFDRDSDDRINFRSFVQGLSIFSSNARPEVRPHVIFRLFDVDKDDYISVEDLNKVLGLMVGTEMSPSALAAVVAATMEAADMDRDGRISYDDFEASMANTSWEALAIPVKGSLRFEARAAAHSAASEAPAMPTAASFARLPGAAGGKA